MDYVTPPTETFTFHSDGSLESIMHQPTDGWLSLLSFVASHYFPSQSIRKQRWKRVTETDKKKELEERNKKRAANRLLLSAICERLKQSWKVVLFLSQNVGMVIFLGGNLMICKTVWICNWRCYFYFIYLSDWTPFPLIVLLRIRAIAFLGNAQNTLWWV